MQLSTLGGHLYLLHTLVYTQIFNWIHLFYGSQWHVNVYSQRGVRTSLKKLDIFRRDRGVPEHLKISSGEIYRYYQGKIFDFDSVIFCLGQVLSFMFTSKWGYTLMQFVLWGPIQEETPRKSRRLLLSTKDSFPHKTSFICLAGQCQ